MHPNSCEPWHVGADSTCRREKPPFPGSKMYIIKIISDKYDESVPQQATKVFASDAEITDIAREFLNRWLMANPGHPAHTESDIETD